MNSSAFSSNHNLSSLNESSCSVGPCCSHQLQYQNLYQQLSNLRIQHRHLVQQRQVFRNTVQGLQQQNRLMKNFLNGKKEMVNKLNMENILCNQQINRLEDEIHSLMKSKETSLEQLQKVKEKLLQSEAQIGGQHQKFRLLTQRFKIFEQQSKKIKEEQINHFQTLLRQKDNAIQSITKIFNSKLVKFEKQYTGQSKQTQIIYDKEKARTVTNKPYTTSIAPQICNSVEIKLNSILIASKLKQQNYEKQLNKKNKIVESLNEKIGQLQNQMSESMELLQVYMKEMNGLKLVIKNKQLESLQNAQIDKQKIKRKDDSSQKIIAKLIEIIKSNFINQNISAFDKLLEISNNSRSSSFQIQILINEIKSLADVNHIESLKHSLESKQLNRLNRENGQLRERIELMTLKFNTLERQYREIVEDNNRLIKYNNLTQYRLNRNLGGMTHSINNNHYKCDGEKTPITDKSSLRKTVDRFSNKQNYQLSCNK